MRRPPADPTAVILTAQSLEKAFGSAPIVHDVSVAIHEGERIGLVGANGSGKSTLARLLAGLDTPDGGQLARRRGATVEILEQEPRFAAGATVWDVVLSGLSEWVAAKARYDEASRALSVGGAGGMDALLEEQARASAAVEQAGGWDVEHQVRAMLGHVGLSDPDRVAETLSGGERRRAALARILISEPTLAILDEPSNHLDIATVEWLEEYLLDSFGGALLLITHDRYLLDRVCTCTWEMQRGSLVQYDGGYETYLEGKAERDELAHRTEQNRQNFLRRELEWLRRQPKARTGKQKARISRAESARDVPLPQRERKVELSAHASRSSKIVLELHEVGIELGGRTLVDGLDLRLTAGERVGIVGPNGCGKSTLLDVLVGERAPTRGRVTLGPRTEFAYFTQHKTGLDDALDIRENVAGDRGRIELGERVMEVIPYLEQFGFDARRQLQPVGSLSGGERARVALAKLLSTPANVVILDEPTNDLDVSVLSSLEEMLLSYPGTALIVTHDRYLLNRVATAVLVFEGEGRLVRYAGGYDDYLSQRRARPDEASSTKPSRASAPPPAAAPTAAEDEPEAKPLTYAEAKELETLHERVEAADARVAELEAQVSDPTLYASGGASERATAVVAELEAAREASTALWARWEDLEARRDVKKGKKGR